MRRLLAIAAVAMIPTMARAEGFICAIEKMTGFSKKSGSWQTATFNVDDQKFVVRRSTRQTEQVKWEVVDLGRSNPIIWCKEDFNSVDNLFCDGIGEFRMNRKTLRFLYVYPFGYFFFEPGEEGANTPAIGIGKCSPM